MKEQLITCIPGTVSTDNMSRLTNELEKLDIQADFQRDGNNNFNLSMEVSKDADKDTILAIGIIVGKIAHV